MSDPAPHHSFPWRITAIVAAVIVVATVAVGLLLARDRVAQTTAPISTATGASASTSVSASPQPLEDSRQLTLLLTVRSSRVDAQAEAAGYEVLHVRTMDDAPAACARLAEALHG